MNAIKVRSLVLITALPLLACGPQNSENQLNEAWNASNNPTRIMAADSKYKWSDLPLTGAIAQKGWSDDYWPTTKGGISFRWQANEINYPLYKKANAEQLPINTLSPAEKYDLFMGRLDFPTVMDERRRTSVLKTIEGSEEFDASYSIPSWEGLCHGWAPAALNFKEPTASVSVPSRVGNLEFYASDIKALLIYYQQYNGNRSTRTSLLADRCHVEFSKLDEKLKKGEISQQEWQETRESGACADINAGSFHLLLANEIGLKKTGFVIDITRDFEVWNQPVNDYKSVLREIKEGASEGAAPGTVKELRVDTVMLYTVETAPAIDPVGAVEKTAFYSYILELNAKEEIIGGRWLSENRPDFAWRETVPEFRGYFAGLKHLYEKAIQTSPVSP